MKLRPSLVIGVAALSVAAGLIAADAETPIGPKWWPGEWGQDDQRGAANRMTPEKAVEAARLIKTGKTYQLGRVYEHGIPMPGKRHFSLTIPGSPTGVDGDLVYHDDMFSGEIGQVGTQLDGLGHVGVRLKDDDYFYNGVKRSELKGAHGLETLGIEHVGAFFARGVLIDVAGYKGVERMKVGEPVTDKDLQGALQKQGVEVREGDIVLVRTGHGRLWMKDNAEYGRGEPGIDMSAARWLSDRKVTLIGGDNWALEVRIPADEPQPKDHPFGIVHMHLLPRHGIYILENLDLDELAKDKAYEFAFIYAPLKLKGATGSPGNPIAVR